MHPNEIALLHRTEKGLLPSRDFTKMEKQARKLGKAHVAAFGVQLRRQDVGIVVVAQA